MRRFSSKSSSKTASGSRTYADGVAIATSGSTTSHFLTWYSIHSLLIAMSPSRYVKRGSERNGAILSDPMSRPETCQSVSWRMRSVSAFPMKPLTPRMRTLTRSLSCPGPRREVLRRVRLGAALALKREELDVAVVAAGDVQPALLGAHLARERVVRGEPRQARAPDVGPGLEEIGERAGKRMRDGANEVVNFPGRPAPVDAAVFGPPPPEPRRR